MTEKRARGWCITINNWTDEDLFSLYAQWDAYDDCDYLIIGYEIGEKNGTLHLQAYLHYNHPIRLTSMQKRMWDKKVQFTPQKAKFNVNAYCYCMKDVEKGRIPNEFGERPRQGHRTDLEVIKLDLLRGKTMKDVSLDNFSQWCQYRRAFGEFREMHDKVVVYKTQLIAFESEEICKVMRNVYTMYDSKIDYLILSFAELLVVQVVSLLCSGKYRYIFCPIIEELDGEYSAVVRHSGIESFYDVKIEDDGVL